MSLIYGALIVAACHLTGLFVADVIRRDGDWPRWTSLSYAVAVGILCAVIW